MKTLAAHLAVIIFFFLFFTQNVHAQVKDFATTTRQSTFDDFTPQLESDVEPNLHSLTQGLVFEILSAISCQLSGLDPLSVDGRCLTVNPQTKKLAYAENAGGGAIGFMAIAMGSTYNIPISGLDYGKTIASNFGIVKKADAQIYQGVGFNGLRPVLGVWKVFRNLVYVAFILIFMFIGLSIMLRVHIDPRTVMTIQNQLPKIIVALVLITFSYAIAGLMIDFMYVLIFLAFNVALQIYESLGISQPEIPNMFTNPFNFVDKLYAPDWVLFRNTPWSDNMGIMAITFSASWNVGSLISSLFGGIFDTVIGSIFKALFIPFGALDIACDSVDKIPHLSQIPGLGFIPYVGRFLDPGLIDKIPIVGSLPFVGGGGPECNIADKMAEIVVGGIAGIIAFLVILFAILVSLFRLWFMLIKAFIFLLLGVSFAPFWIALGLIPGNSLGFSAWIRDIISNLVVFPAVIVLFMLGRIFMDAFSQPLKGSEFIPPLLGDPGETSILPSLIGLGIIIMTPQLLNDIKTMLKSPNPQLPAIKQNLGFGGEATKQLTSPVREKFIRKNPQTGAYEGILMARAQSAWNNARARFSGRRTPQNPPQNPPQNSPLIF